jgi:hypothetical protein
MVNRRRNGLAVFAAGAFLFGAQQLCSQDATGRVAGTVMDPAGATVPGARIIVINVDTKLSREATSANDGTYQVLQLPIGQYQITAEKTGFNKLLIGNQQLNINQTLHVDLQLTVGSVSETVQVEGTAAGVETINATLGGSVTSRPIVNLPLNGRNVLDLVALQPGVTLQRPSGGPSGFSYSIAGSRTDSITYLLDGGNNNNLLNNGVVYNPNPDSVAEFRVLTSNYTAEYGRNGGGVISIVTKSGTNDIHGSAYDYGRNDAFNANTFFNNQSGAPRPILKRQQFGATLGGPVMLPKFNGRNKAFFFLSYQGQRQSEIRPTSATSVFTTAELNGDFSRSNSARNGPSPGVVAYLAQFPYFQPNPSLAAQGIIDPTRINPISQNFVKAGLIPNSATGVVVPQIPAKNDRDEITPKIDLNLTQKDRISVTLGASRNPALNPTNFFNGAAVNGFDYLNKVHNYLGNAAYTRTFTPTLLNEFRFTAQRNNTLQAVPAYSKPNAAALGIKITPDDPTGPPLLSFSNGGVLTGFSPQGPTALINNTYSWSDTLTWTRGHHNIKLGGAYSVYQNNTNYDFYVNGEFYFSGTSGIGSGNDRADFLMGLPDEYSQSPQAPSDIRSKYYSWFAQDEWHARSNLVLTFGLRYDYSTPKLDTRGRAFSLNYGQKSTVFPNAPRGLVFPGDTGAPKGANFPDKNDFGPRFGFAWDPSGKGRTSIRGGFGVFYDILKAEDNLQYNGQAPFFGFADLFFDPLAKNPTTAVNYFSDPFGAAGSTNPFPSKPPSKNLNFDDAGFLPFGGGGVYFVNPHLRTPYIYQYNLSVQQTLARDLTAEVNYVGNNSHKLTGLLDSNPFALGTTSRLFNRQPGETNSSFSYLDTFDNVGNGQYNSLEASLRKGPAEVKYLGTTYFTLAWTYGHAIDTTSGFRERNSRVPYYNHKQFRASSDEDVRHRIVFSGGWDMPLDRLHGAPKLLARGWSLYPIVSFNTGYPLDVLAGISRSRTRTGPSAAGDPNLVRANLVGSSVTTFDPKNSLTVNGQTGNYYFNPANFSIAAFSAAGFDPVANPAQRTYGTLGRNAFRTPGRTNMDLALAKRTPLGRERFNSELRLEAFNLFNTVQFREPNTTITSSTFGQITDTYAPRIVQIALRLTF